MSRFVAFFFGIAAVLVSIACGPPPAAECTTDAQCLNGQKCLPDNQQGNNTCQSPNGGGQMSPQPTACTTDAQCLNGQKCQGGMCVTGGGQMNNPQPDMGGGNNLPPGTCPSTAFTVKAYWANGRGSGAYMTGSYASASPTWGQVQNNPSDGNGNWTMCIPRTVQGYAITPCGYLDRHVQQIGSGPGQTNDDTKIGWCGGNTSCKPDKVWIDGIEVPAATLANWNFVQGRGWPLVFLAGTGSICSTTG